MTVTIVVIRKTGAEWWTNLQNGGQQLQSALVVLHGWLKVLLLHANVSQEWMYVCSTPPHVWASLEQTNRLAWTCQVWPRSHKLAVLLVCWLLTQDILHGADQGYTCLTLEGQDTLIKCMNEWQETARQDKKQPFRANMTASLQKELVTWHDTRPITVWAHSWQMQALRALSEYTIFFFFIITGMDHCWAFALPHSANANCSC